MGYVPKNSDMIQYEKIEQAYERIKNVVLHTPLMKNNLLSEAYGANVYLKREDMQLVRSFKLRGAYNKISQLNKPELSRGIVCASAGNHAQGVAFACADLGVKGIIYMPAATPLQKVTKVKHFGREWVEVILTGDTFDDAKREALHQVKKTQSTFIDPFDDNEVAAGQGTIGIEILDDHATDPIDYLFVPVGGGGLISGLASYFKVKSPNTKIIAVEAEGSASLKASLDAQKLVTLSQIDAFADGVAVKTVGRLAFQVCSEWVHDVVTVPEGEICSTILKLYNDDAIVVEPAGALAVSALAHYQSEIQGKNVVVVVSGGNNDITRTEDIRERALLWEGRKHYFVIRFPQRAGALREFLTVLGPKDDIAHFEYTKKNNRQTGPALVGIELEEEKDFNPLVQRMRDANIDYHHLNGNPLLFEMLV